MKALLWMKPSTYSKKYLKIKKQGIKNKVIRFKVIR